MLEAYETAEHCDQEIINVLQLKFPNGLADLEIEDGMLPLDLTGRLAFEHIEGKVISSHTATKAYQNLVKDIANRLYVPNGNGPMQYFQEMKRDQLSAAIVKGGVITMHSSSYVHITPSRRSAKNGQQLIPTSRTHRVRLFIRTHSFEGSKITTTND